ncbi:hypothetical protein IGB42_04314 [Andreprevotia sp. IGB-42]|nr:hypothetical protein IGB42_04314 [Andreprevotia sp. IGB-42]
MGDNLRSPQQAAFVLLHEVLGHAGLRGVFGDGLNPLMNSIYRDHADVREDADRLMQQYGYDKALAVEEVLADRAAMGQAREASWWQKIMLAFKNYLRQNGFGWAVTKWSDAEIEQLLASA